MHRGALAVLLVRIVGVAYLLMCLAIGLVKAIEFQAPNILATYGWDGPRQEARALLLTACLAVLVALIALATRKLAALQWFVAGAVCLWLLASAVSTFALTRIVHPELVGFAITGAGVALAAGLAGASATRWTLYWSGSAWALGSIFVGYVSATSDGTLAPAALELDPGDRYTRWLQTFGLDVGAGSTQALVGLSLHRQLLGMLLAMFLVLQVRHLISTGCRGGLRVWLLILGPLPTGIALLWTLSRTSILAAALGLAVSLLPIQRIRLRWATPILSLAVVLIVVAPVLFREAVITSGDGTLAWRGSLWDEILDIPGFWSSTGIGHFAPLPGGAAHAHNQALETIGSGGWLGLCFVIVFVVLGAYAAAGAARRDGRTAFACLVTAAAISQFEVIGRPLQGAMKPGLLVLVAVVASSAGLVATRRPQTRPVARRIEMPSGSGPIGSEQEYGIGVPTGSNRDAQSGGAVIGGPGPIGEGPSLDLSESRVAEGSPNG